MKIKQFFVAIFLAMLSVNVLFAHPGHEHVPVIRTWKGNDGVFAVRASFVVTRQGQVQLMTKEGQSLWIPIEKLCAHDCEWIANKIETIRFMNEARMRAEAELRNVEEYGYYRGTFLPPSGHVRVNVSAEKAVIDYVRSYLATAENSKQKNRDVSHSFTIRAKE